MIKVVIVDDSGFVRKILKEMLSADREIELLAEYADGKDLLENISEIKPDVIILDLVMTTIDGLWALETLHKRYPVPVIVFSSISKEKSDIEKEAFLLGAFDVIQKPANPQEIPRIKARIIEAVRKAAQHLLPEKSLKPEQAEKNAVFDRVVATRVIVAIGSSAGGPPAVKQLINSLPENFPGCILVAQHMPDNFIIPFMQHISEGNKFRVKIAEEGEVLTFGRVYISPVSKTLTVSRLRRGYAVSLTQSDCKPKPSINDMFKSAAQAGRYNVIGVILSGMGEDGVAGLEEIKKMGGRTLAQDQKSSIVYGMPKAAALSGFVDNILPVEKIAGEIVRMLGAKR